jgi:hypothetical protein
LAHQPFTQAAVAVELTCVGQPRPALAVMEAVVRRNLALQLQHLGLLILAVAVVVLLIMVAQPLTSTIQALAALAS